MRVWLDVRLGLRVFERVAVPLLLCVTLVVTVALVV